MKIIIVIIGIIPIMTSCEHVYISTPQPVDSKNIYVFPKEYRGVWTCEENTVIIGKDFFKYIQNLDFKVSKIEIDSSSSYVLKDNKLYIIDNRKMELKGGFPYKLKNDTIYYQEPEVLEIALGKKAFLRKIKKNYILNNQKENQWWELILIKKDKKGNIIVEKLDIKDLDKFTNYRHIHSFKAKYSRSDYIEANWTKKELLEMLNKGMFSDTLATLEINNTIKC